MFTGLSSSWGKMLEHVAAGGMTGKHTTACQIRRMMFIWAQTDVWYLCKPKLKTKSVTQLWRSLSASSQCETLLELKIEANCRLTLFAN